MWPILLGIPIPENMLDHSQMRREGDLGC